MSGEGSVFKRASDGAWLAQISRGPRGARKTWTRSAATKSEALRRLIELRAELDRSQPTPSGLTGSFLEQWANDARNIRPNTRRGYLVVIRNHLAPTIGHIPLTDLRPAHVERMLALLTPLVSEKYLRNIHAVLRRGLGQAVRLGMVPLNVASREFIETPKVSPTDPDALTQAQVDALIAAADGDRLQALVVVLADCGLRVGEALGLWWQDIRPDSIQVELELTYRDGEYRREAPKTPRSRRSVPLTDRAKAALDAHRAGLIEQGVVPIATGYVFTNTTGGPLSGSWFTHHFHDLCERAGLDRRPPKILRATFSSELYRLGVPEIVIADLMGHARTRTTKRHYIATTPAQAQDAVSVLSQSRNQSRPVGETPARTG